MDRRKSNHVQPKFQLKGYIITNTGTWLGKFFLLIPLFPSSDKKQSAYNALKQRIFRIYRSICITWECLWTVRTSFPKVCAILKIKGCVLLLIGGKGRRKMGFLCLTVSDETVIGGTIALSPPIWHQGSLI